MGQEVNLSHGPGHRDLKIPPCVRGLMSEGVFTEMLGHFSQHVVLSQTRVGMMTWEKSVEL